MSSLPLDLMRAGGTFSRDPRFTPLFRTTDIEAPAAAIAATVDPVIDAYERGYAEGLAHAREEAEQEAAERDRNRAAIELAFARMDDKSAIELRERLQQTVLALCEDTILPLALDHKGLAARVENAAAMLQRSQDERRVLLNPDDLEEVRHRLPPDLIVEGDPSVERGALRIETPDGGIEDGPTQWRRILAEAFGQC